MPRNYCMQAAAEGQIISHFTRRCANNTGKPQFPRIALLSFIISVVLHESLLLELVENRG
jgi:hypothetical protein